MRTCSTLNMPCGRAVTSDNECFGYSHYSGLAHHIEVPRGSR